MKKFVRDIIEVSFIIFNAFISLFSFVGIYVFAGGSLEDKLNFYIIPMILFFIYGTYIGFKAIDNIERRK